MRWDEKVDSSIIESLGKDQLHTEGLYEQVCSRYRGISFDAFNRHLKKLVADGYIKKSSIGIGKKASHCLTEKARRSLRIGTFDIKSKKGRVRRGVNSERIKCQKLYVLLLLFRHRTIYRFDTEIEFDNFLTQFKLTSEQLIQTHSPNFIHISGDGSYQYLGTAWKSPNGDIEISKHDITHRKDSTGNLRRLTQPEFYYSCSVKGLTEREVLNSDLRLASSSFRITREEAEEAFRILHKENLLKPIAVYKNEVLYAVSDERSDEFLQDCLEVYEFVSGGIIDIWGSISRPNPQEVRWLEFFIGKEGTDKIRNHAYETKKAKRGMTTDDFYEWLKWWRHSLKKSKDDIDAMVTDLKKKHELTIQKYPYPSNDVLELVYPNFLENTFQITKKKQKSN